MEYSEACIELAKLIKSEHYQSPEEAGLAIEILNRSIISNDDPVMALELAKNLDIS